MKELNKLYHEDCLEGLKDIPSESVDCVVTDCPYKIVKRGNVGTVSGILRTKECRNGKMFAHNTIQFTDWLPEIYRVLKKGTHCYIMINSRNLKSLQIAAEQVGFYFQNLLVWEKGNYTPNKFYMQGAEFVLMLSKRPERYINDCGSRNILKVPNIVGNKLHPTEKPVPLMEMFIRNSTNEGDIVLDPFTGAGATLIAAKRLNRQYIGFEIDEKYYHIAEERLKGTIQENTLF